MISVTCSFISIIREIKDANAAAAELGVAIGMTAKKLPI